MRTLAEETPYQYVIIDMVAPLPEMRTIINPDFTIWLDTITQSRYTDTNKIFVEPKNIDFRITEQDAMTWACTIAKKILNGYTCS